jgi:hypothetical protein
MSDIISPDFGKTPVLNKGDFVRFSDCTDGLWGIVVSVDERYRFGDIAGQARILSVAIPTDETADGDEEDGEWTIERDVELSELTRIYTSESTHADEKAGQVLQFCVR